MAFIDMFTSIRGLFTFGTILSVITLAGFLILGTLTLDKRFWGGGKTLKAEIAEMQDDIRTTKKRLEESHDKIAILMDRERKIERLTAVQISTQELKDSNARESSRFADLQGSFRQTDEMFADYRAKYRNKVRTAAVGIEMEELKTLDGKSYQKAKIREIDPLGMSITHREGSCRIDYKQLPRDMQEYYQFDAEEARNRRLAELDHSRQVQLAQAVAKRDSDREASVRRAERERREEADRQASIAKLNATLMNYDRKIMELESEIRSQAYKSVSRAPILREELEDVRAKKREYEARLRSLQNY